jgi:hypothetical protein
MQMTDTQYARFSRNLNAVTAEIINEDTGAEEIMKNLLSGSTEEQIDPAIFNKKNFHCIIHIIRWSAPAANTGTQVVQAENWYVYRKGHLTQATSDTIPRLYGVKEIVFLYIHLNKQPTNIYTPLYRFEIKQKTPAYIVHALGLFGLFQGQGAAKAITQPTPINHWWAFRRFKIDYSTSDITVTPKMTRENVESAQDMGKEQKFDNEGLYYVDFSVGVPVRKVSQLSFDSTNGLVTAKEVDKTNIMAFLNLYPRKIDIKRTGYDMVPHFVGGVAIDSKPLDKIFVGAGFGPVVANFYIGALFVKQQQLTNLTPGDPATTGQVGSDIRRRYKAQVGFGLNLPVGAIVEKLKK